MNTWFEIIAAAAPTASQSAAALWAGSAVLAAVASGLSLGVKSLIDKRVTQRAGPSDQNEATRIGNEFLSGLLRDAREERKELRETIKGLELDGNIKQERINALIELDRKKTAQIDALEQRAAAAAAKLQAGLPLTLADILGPNQQLAHELLGDLEDTAMNT